MGILQARILEWVAICFSRESSQPKDQTQVSHIAGGFFTIWTTREAAVNVGIFVWTSAFNFLGIYLEVELLDHTVILG